MAGPLLALPFALPSAGAATKFLLGYGSLALGGSALSTGLVGLNEDLTKEFGWDPKSRIKGEKYDRESGKFERYGIIDKLHGGLLQQDEQDLLNLALQEDNKRILKDNQQLINETTTALQRSGLPGLNYKGTVTLPDGSTKRALIGNDESESLLTQRLERRKEVADLLTTAITKEGLPQDRVDQLVAKGTQLKVSDIQGAINDWKKTDPDGLIQTGRETRDQTKKVTDQQITESQAKIADLGAGRGIQRDQLGLQEQGLLDARYNADENRRFQQWLESSRMRADTAARKDKMDLAALQIQQNSLDRQYMRERDSRLDARAERDKKLALILAAIGNIGRGFAV